MSAGRGETRALQAVVAVLSLVPISAGAAGVLLGPSLFKAAAPVATDLDSHVRYLSGILLAIGVAFLLSVPDIASKTRRVRLLSALIVAGGLARLLSLLTVGAPSAAHLGGLTLEVVVVPLLVIWHARVARG